MFQLSKSICFFNFIQVSSEEKANYQNKLDTVVIQYGRHKMLICKYCEIVRPVLSNMYLLSGYIPNIVYQTKLYLLGPPGFDW